MNLHQRFTFQKLTATAALAALLATGYWAGPLNAEENDRPSGGFGLSRFFRFGSSQPAARDNQHHHNHDLPPGSQVIDSGEIPQMARGNSSAGRGPVGGDVPAFQPAVTSPGFGQSNASRITPRTNYSGPVTEADPILTRVGIGRADSGSTFGLFLQIYADGTVIDSEGVHRLPTSQIRQIVNVIRGHDFSRIKGHCGQPSADFVENVQMIVYDRSLGRLRAHAFSYAGNPEGCDPSVAHLHKAVEDLVLTMAGGKPSDSASASGRIVTGEMAAQPITPNTVSLPVSPNVTGLPPVIESSGIQPQPVQNQPFVGQAQPVAPAIANGNYTQGVVVPRLPSPTIPPAGVTYGTASSPALAPPR
jgi:hypothetical protein